MGGETPLFTTADEVEVRNCEEGFRGAWFEATVLRTMPRVKRYTVTYNSLLSDESKLKSLRETVEWCNVRPRQPTVKSDAVFGVGRTVDAYFKGAWWTGYVESVDGLGDGGGMRYNVCFPESGQKVVFEKEEVRAHLDWVDGKWVDPQRKEINREPEVKFCEGAHVEVSSEEEGFRGAWYTATIIKTIGKTKFLVEHHNIKTDDEKDQLKETVDSLHIRPSPPISTVAEFKVLEEVDALFQDGWWVGVISQVEGGGKYLVYFMQTNEEMHFLHHELRLHHEWLNGRWFQATEEALQL